METIHSGRVNNDDGLVWLHKRPYALDDSANCVLVKSITSSCCCWAVMKSTRERKLYFVRRKVGIDTNIWYRWSGSTVVCTYMYRIHYIFMPVLVYALTIRNTRNIHTYIYKMFLCRERIRNIVSIGFFLSLHGFLQTFVLFEGHPRVIRPSAVSR